MRAISICATALVVLLMQASSAVAKRRQAIECDGTIVEKNTPGHWATIACKSKYNGTNWKVCVPDGQTTVPDPGMVSDGTAIQDAVAPREAIFLRCCRNGTSHLVAGPTGNNSLGIELWESMQVWPPHPNSGLCEDVPGCTPLEVAISGPEAPIPKHPYKLYNVTWNVANDFCNIMSCNLCNVDELYTDRCCKRILEIRKNCDKKKIAFLKNDTDGIDNDNRCLSPQYFSGSYGVNVCSDFIDFNYIWAEEPCNITEYNCVNDNGNPPPEEEECQHGDSGYPACLCVPGYPGCTSEEFCLLDQFGSSPPNCPTIMPQEYACNIGDVSPACNGTTAITGFVLPANATVATKYVPENCNNWDPKIYPALPYPHCYQEVE